MNTINNKVVLWGDLYKLTSAHREEIFSYFNRHEKAMIATLSSVFARKIARKFCEEIGKDHSPSFRFAAKRLGLIGAAELPEEAAKKELIEFHRKTNRCFLDIFTQTQKNRHIPNL